MMKPMMINSVHEVILPGPTIAQVEEADTIIYSLVRAHNGSITLLPSQRGAAFEIRLPLSA